MIFSNQKDQMTGHLTSSVRKNKWKNNCLTFSPELVLQALGTQSVVHGPAAVASPRTVRNSQSRAPPQSPQIRISILTRTQMSRAHTEDSEGLDLSFSLNCTLKSSGSLYKSNCPGRLGAYKHKSWVSFPGALAY